MPAIQKLTAHFIHVRITGTHYCKNQRQEAFKRWVELHNVFVGAIM